MIRRYSSEHAAKTSSPPAVLDLPNACSGISEIFKLTSAICRNGAALFLVAHFVSEIDADMMDIVDFRCLSSAVLPCWKGCSYVGGGDMASWPKREVGASSLQSPRSTHLRLLVRHASFPYSNSPPSTCWLRHPSELQNLLYDSICR